MQMAHYKNYIESRADWDFVGMYSDEGISGTNTKKRDGFNQMIEDALAGKIDLIITKSVSRFARNTVDSLQNVRKLKEHGVEIYFENKDFYTPKMPRTRNFSAFFFSFGVLLVFEFMKR